MDSLTLTIFHPPYFLPSSGSKLVHSLMFSPFNIIKSVLHRHMTTWTRACISLILKLLEILLLYNRFSTVIVCAILESISGFQPSYMMGGPKKASCFIKLLSTVFDLYMNASVCLIISVASYLICARIQAFIH